MSLKLFVAFFISLYEKTLAAFQFLISASASEHCSIIRMLGRRRHVLQLTLELNIGAQNQELHTFCVT